jgi:hypothetical protein
MFAKKEKTGVWLVDVQVNLFPLIERAQEVQDNICFFLDAARLLKLPVFVTEQYPKGLGATVPKIKEHLPVGQIIYSKTLFSGYKEPHIVQAADNIGIDTWILMGIETHICVLQTAKDLLVAEKEVIVLKDAIGSRSSFDHSCGIEEMRDLGMRLTCIEAVLYEIIRDAASPDFKAILPLVKAHA